MKTVAAAAVVVATDDGDGQLTEDEHGSCCSELNVEGDDDGDVEKAEDPDVVEGRETSDRTPEVTGEVLDCSNNEVTPSGSDSRQKSSDSDRDLAALERGWPACRRGAVPPRGRSPAHDSLVRLRFFRGGGTGTTPYAGETSEENAGRRVPVREIPDREIPSGVSGPAESSITESEYCVSADVMENADGELQKLPSVEACEVSTSSMDVGTASGSTL